MVVNDSSKKGFPDDSMTSVRQVSPSALATSEVLITLNRWTTLTLMKSHMRPIGQNILLPR